MRFAPSRHRRHLAIGLGVVLLLVGGWLVATRLGDPWPARPGFRVGGGQWPLAFAPDGKVFVTGKGDQITFWDGSSGQQRRSWTTPATTYVTTPVAGTFAPDGATFAAALGGGQGPVRIVLFDIATGRVKAEATTDQTQAYELHYSPDGLTLLFHANDRSGLRGVVTCDGATGQPTSFAAAAPTVPGSRVVGSPDGRYLLEIPRAVGPVLLRDLRSQPARPPVVMAGLPSAGTVTVGFAPGGQMLAVGRDDGRIDLWDIAAGRLIRTLPPAPGRFIPIAIRWAPDGRTIAQQGFCELSAMSRIGAGVAALVLGRPNDSDVVVVRDVQTGAVVGRSDTAIFPYYAPDSRTIATREHDGSIRLHDLTAR